MTMIRPPHVDELPRLQEIEVEAGRAFIDIGMPEVAGDDALPLTELEAWRAAGRAWVVELEGTVEGYVVVDLLDGHAHVEQVSVDPRHRGHRLGRDLLDHVAAWARGRGDARVTLTTFREVPWNAPYYERCGYRVLADDERGPDLVARMQLEADHGLDPETRVAMALDLDPSAS